MNQEAKQDLLLYCLGAATGEASIAKLERLSNSDWEEFVGQMSTNRIILVLYHRAKADGIIESHIPDDFMYDKILYADYSEADGIAEAVIEAFNQGALIINFLGHGDQNTWGDEGIFNPNQFPDHLKSLSNLAALPFVVSMNCLNGFFTFPDMPSYDLESISEKLLKLSHGGAVAMWASSSLTDPQAHIHVYTSAHR